MFPKSAKRSDSISNMKSGGGISFFCGSELGIAKVDGEFGRVSTSAFVYDLSEDLEKSEIKEQGLQD